MIDKYDIFFIDTITGAIIFEQLNAPFLFNKSMFKKIKYFKSLLCGNDFNKVKKFLFPNNDIIKSVLFHMYLIYRKKSKKLLFTCYFNFVIYPAYSYKFTFIDKIKIKFLKMIYFLLFTFIL